MKHLLIFLMAFGLLGCGNDDDTEVETERDLFFFLDKTNPQFSGDLNNQFIIWQTFPLGDFSSNGLITTPSGDPDSSIKEITYFMSEGSTRISITAPVYDTASASEIANVFGLGIKNLGFENSDYKIVIESGTDTYQLCLDDRSTFDLEIIKTEEDQFGGLNVWFVVDNIDMNACEESASGTINNGLFLAKFPDYSALE